MSGVERVEYLDNQRSSIMTEQINREKRWVAFPCSGLPNHVLVKVMKDHLAISCCYPSVPLNQQPTAARGLTQTH